MSVYHQMGHDSINLVGLPELGGYAGAIISPVNYTEVQVREHLDQSKDRKNFEWVFDPQLYYPRSERGKLPGWSYFPSNVDTADMHSEEWWTGVVADVVETCARVLPTAACSPAFAANSYPDDYYVMMNSIGNTFAAALNATSIRPIQTVLANISDIAQPNRAMEIASIVSRTKASSVFLVLVNDVPPRRELKEPEQLSGAIRLISALEAAGLIVNVGYCSSEFVLWKHAGATHCSTGKFFNLRRFTKTRFDEPTDGGGQLPYWFEENLLAFLRESDIVRVRSKGLLSENTPANPFSAAILNCISHGDAWLGMSWRHYMYAFCDLERRICGGQVEVPELLKRAEDNWRTLEDGDVLMEEVRNDGAWIRAWRRAVSEANKPSVTS